MIPLTCQTDQSQDQPIRASSLAALREWAYPGSWVSNLYKKAVFLFAMGCLICSNPDRTQLSITIIITNICSSNIFQLLSSIINEEKGRGVMQFLPSSLSFLALSLFSHTHSAWFMHRFYSTQLVQFEHVLRAHPLSLPTRPRITSN